MTPAPMQIATALLVREGRALLAHRVASRLAHPDSWGLAGGHVEPGETPQQAAIRECLEELGTQIRHPRQIPMMVNAADIEMHTFLVTDWTAEPYNAAPEEHDEVRWFLPGDIVALRLAHPESLSDILSAITLVTGSRRRP